MNSGWRILGGLLAFAGSFSHAVQKAWAEHSANTVVARDDTTSGALVDGILALVQAANKPNVARDSALMDASANAVQEMLRALDRDNSQAALQDLSRLNHYYLGEAFGETLECVIVRKSIRILPLLKAASNEHTDHCKRNGRAESAMCLSSRESRDRFLTLIKRIERNEHCVIEE